MAIRIRVEKFKGEFRSKNTPGRTAAVSTADVVRAAVTVGGPVKGTSWRKSQRRAAIAGTVLSALVGKGRHYPLRTSSLYEQLETTEKSGVSFRLGMAFAAIAAEQILEVKMLEHLNQSNSTLYPSGGKRRADLFGLSSQGDCHVIEAKSSTYGPSPSLVDEAKQQAANIQIVDATSGRYEPLTRSAAVTDLSLRPVSVLLADPPEAEKADDVYRIDTERLIEDHYSVVPDLLDLHDDEQEPPVSLDADIIGALLPGMDIWLGMDRSLYGPSDLSWTERIDRLGNQPPIDGVTEDQDTVSVGRDGHVLQLGPELSRIYESWQERDDVEDEPDEARQTS